MRATAVITYDVRGVVCGWSSGACALFGYDRAEAVGKPISELLVDDGPPPTDPALEEDATEAVLVTKNAEHVVVVRTRVAVRDAQGQVVAVVAVLNPMDAALQQHADVLTARTGTAKRENTAGAPCAGDPLLRRLVDALPQLIWTCDAAGRCDYQSERWQNYVGAATERADEWAWLGFVHPDDRDSTAAAWKASIAKGSDCRVECRLRGQEGSYRWFEVNARPLRDEAGSIVEWIVSNTDVHERRESNQALEHERERLERLTLTAPGIPHSYRVAPDGSITYPFAGPGIGEIYGATAEELARDATPVWTSILSEDLEAVRREVAISASTMTPYRGEYRVRHPTRGVLWIEAHSSPKWESDGSINWVGFTRDITERKRAEESLRTTQSQLVAALEAGNMGLWTWEVERDELHVDELLLKLLERKREELSGTSADIYAFAHREDVGKIQTALEALASSRTTCALEYRIICPDGSLKWLSLRARCDCDADGKVARVTALQTDVTSQKTMAEAQLHAQKLESLGTLASGIAHDFNNILQAITGNAALALCSLPGAHPARGHLDAVTIAAARASDLVRRILAFSRPAEPALQVLSLSEATAEALKLVRATLPATIDLRAELNEAVPKVAADATQIHQVVVNLTTNAAHAIGPRAGSIRVRLGVARKDHRAGELPPELADGSYAVLQVSDEGSGMSPATLKRIFDPFFTTKPIGQGTGLGLSVVHGIVKSLGGAIAVQSEPDRGTTFSLYFPAANDAEVAPSKASAEIELPVIAGERILLVDDEPALVVLGTTLLKMLGYRPTGRRSSLEALRTFEAAPYDFDAVITDVSMPDMSGFDFAERLRARRTNLPIVMLSGFVGPVEREHAKRIGVHELLVKPVSIAELQHAVARALQEARTKSTATRLPCKHAE